MYKHIIFDVDGTLIDTRLSNFLSLKKVLKEMLGRDFSEKELSFSIGIPGIYTMKQLNVPNKKAALNKWDEYIQAYKHNNTIFKGIISLLENLEKNHFHLSVVTSRRSLECTSDPIFQSLSPFFKAIVTADDTQKHKPFPEPLLHCLGLTQISYSETLYIGDTPYDSQCARDAKVDFALAGWGVEDDNAIDATYHLKRPLNLLSIL